VDCGTPLEPGPAPEDSEEEHGEVEFVRAPAAPPPAVEPEPNAWDEATARVWGDRPFEPDLDAWIDVDEDDVDVDETGYALVMVSSVLTVYGGAERLAGDGIDARVVVPEPPADGSPAPEAELRVPWDRLEDARRILGLVV
jgi:hypothetical protein